MHILKQNTSSHQENKLVLSCSYTSREEFIRKYRKFYHEKAKAKEFYLLLLIELKNAVSAGNVESLKNLSSLIGHISSVENQATLKAYYYDKNNPIKNTNLVILASKHNKIEILKCLFENSDILNNLSVDDAIVPGDEDETCHNAFYYAIRSGNVELLDALINKWPDDYFAARLEELEIVLSKSYEELKLKNVPLTDEIEIFVENKLISLRLFSNSSEQVHSVKDDFNNIKERLGLLLENIRLLKKEYLNRKNVDERFLFVAKFIAQNVHVLKRQLKSTYNRLPWEEIEFCLVCFVSSHIKQHEINLFVHAALNKGKILNYLENFAKTLEGEKVLKNIDISKLAVLPKLKRDKVVAELISNNPQFEELYNVYRKIRDAYSLGKIRSYIDLALLVDSETKEGQLVITRSMQIIGEYIKNTLESPKLSNTTSEFLLLTLPKNTREIIADLRNSLSHAYSLFKRTEIEECTDVKFFANVQNDIKKLGIVISDILHNKKLEVIKELLEKILDSTDQVEIEETADILSNIQMCDMISVGGIRSQEEDKVEELIKELKSKMKDKTYCEKKLFNEIDDIMNSKNSNIMRLKSDYMLESIHFLLGNKRIDIEGTKAIRTFADDILVNIKPKVGSNNLKKVAKLVFKIFKSYMLKVEDKHINEIINKIFVIAEIDSSSIKWIEELNCKLNIDRSENKKKVQDNKLKEQNYQKILEQRLFTLKDILNKRELGDQIDDKKFSFYKNDRKLQSAIEMLILDIMSTLSSSGNYDLENNQLFLDDYSPLFIGKCLRNHLAHGNGLVDVLLSDPSMAVILNAKHLTTQNIKNKKKIGKLVRDDPSKLKYRYHHGLITITNQEKMFIALEEGHLECLKSCLKEGADINARRHTNLWTALHFAAKGSNLEVVKFILDHTHNLNIDSKDIHNQNPLHIAASFGSYEIVKYFIEGKYMDVNCLDNRRRTPSLIAAQNGHKNVVKFLLENNANINIKDLNGYTPLHYAVKNNHIAIVKSLLEEETNIDINKTEGGLTSLHIASINNHLELVKFLLENKANANEIGCNGWTPLHYIARSGNKSIAYALIKKGADVNAKSIGQGDAPLHIAAEYGNIEIIKVLLNNSADINVKSIRNHDTPLHMASEAGYRDTVKILLDMGADVNAKDKDNYTSLHLAVLRNDNKEVVEALIKGGANINAKCKNGCTPLHYAAMGGYKGVVEVFVNILDDINIKDGKNRTPIELAVLHGHLQVVEILVQHKKANVKIKGNDDFTILHIAAHVGNFEIANRLIEKGADVSAKTNQGDTPLHLAAGYGHKEVVKVLLDNGAKVNAKSNEGFTPLHNAAESGYEEIIEILIEKGSNVDSKDNENNITPLYISVLFGNLDSVKTLLDKRANVNAKSSYNITPLYVAAQIGIKNIAEALIKKGADINAADKDNFTPLHIAASEGHNNIVEVLLNEANVNAKNSKDGTSIELAVLNGHLHVVKTLLHDQRVNINAKDNNGYTVLHIASQTGKLEIVKYLIEEGADVNTKTFHGYTPLHLAVANGYKDIAEVLIAKGSNISIKDNQNRTAEELESAVAYRKLFDSDSPTIDSTPNNDLKVKELFEQILTIREKYFGPNNLKVAEILINIGKTEINLHNYQKAKKLLERGLNIQKEHGSEESVVAETLANLGNVYENLGNPRKQKEFLEQALSIYEKHYGPDHFKVSILLVNLSIAYGNLGNPGKKKTLLERALPIQEKHFGSDHFQMACVLVILGNTYAALGDFKNQRNLLERALKIQEKSTHFSIAFTLNNLGGVCLRLGDIQGAKERFEQALLIKEKHFGIDHFEFANTLVNLGLVYNNLGDNLKAKTFLEQALKIQETHYGSNNFKLAFTLLNLGIVYGGLGDSMKYIKLCKEALSIAEGHYGSDNFEVAKVLSNLGTAYGSIGNNQKAKELLEQTLTIQEKHYGPNNFEVAATLVNLATIYNRLGKHQREKWLLERALDIQEKHGFNQFEVVRTLMKLSQAHRDLGDLQKEKKLIERALEIQENHGLDTFVISKILLSLSIVYGKLGDLYKEKELLEQALAIQEKYGHDSVEAVEILQNLGAVYGNLGNNLMAKMLFEQALKIQERHYGPNHLEVVALLENLCNAYGALGDPKNQMKLLERALSILKKHYGSDHPKVLYILRKIEIINFRINLVGNEVSEILQHRQKHMNNAISNGDIQSIQHLLQEGADANYKDIHGRTLLHYAINNGHMGVVNVLLKNGADVTQSTNKGNTPLHTAASKGYKEIVKVLLQHVSRDKLNNFINFKTISGGATSLHVAAKNGFLDIVKSLMKHGAMYNIENKEGKRPFDLSTDKSVVYLLKLVNELFEDAKNGSLEIIVKLNLAKPDEIAAVLNVRNNQRCTLLQVAIANGHKNIASKILEIINKEELHRKSKYKT